MLYETVALPPAGKTVLSWPVLRSSIPSSLPQPYLMHARCMVSAQIFNESFLRGLSQLPGVYNIELAVITQGILTIKGIECFIKHLMG